MKKLLLIIIPISVCLIAASFFLFKEKSVNKVEEKPANLLQSRDYFIEQYDTGSMEPTIHEGDKLYIYDQEPVVGDIISFKCSKPECLNYKGEIHSGGLTKRLIKIREDGAWWVEGDNKAVSFDSRYFGWVLPSERSNVWVVKL